jgi:hypothetical protein
MINHQPSNHKTSHSIPLLFALWHTDTTDTTDTTDATDTTDTTDTALGCASHNNSLQPSHHKRKTSHSFSFLFSLCSLKLLTPPSTPLAHQHQHWNCSRLCLATTQSQSAF